MFSTIAILIIIIKYSYFRKHCVEKVTKIQRIHVDNNIQLLLDEHAIDKFEANHQSRRRCRTLFIQSAMKRVNITDVVRMYLSFSVTYVVFDSAPFVGENIK